MLRRIFGAKSGRSPEMLLAHFDYFRPVAGLSWRRAWGSLSPFAGSKIRSGIHSGAFALAAVVVVGSCTLLAQYPGKIAKAAKSGPVLRSIAVLEWTGEPGKPSASRLVPISVFDGEQLNDGALYLDRPEPLALDSGVEYVLQQNGRPTGLYDVSGAGEMNGAWRGFGVWKPLSASAETTSREAFNSSSLYNPKVDISEDDDKPVLHRKHPKETESKGDTSSGSNSGTSTGDSSKGSTSGQADPDRPTMHRKSDGDTSSTSSSSAGGNSSARQDVDSERPTLHRHRGSGADDTAGVSNAPPDPDRPRLMHGKPADLGPAENPKLEGNPPSMQQAIAVSDAGNHPVHPWSYSWSDPGDEAKFKAQMEAMARTALGLDAPPAPAKKTTQTATAKTHKKTSLLAPATDEPAPLTDEQFHVYELAYGASATMVLTAATPRAEPPAQTQEAKTDDDAPKIVRRSASSDKYASKRTQIKDDAANSDAAQAKKSAPQKFVTLIAQPDLYGGVFVVYKSVTDAAHLDVKPRMRLVDAVDATADNRAELLFELRGDDQRQFALYRVLRGSAEPLFTTVAMP